MNDVVLSLSAILNYQDRQVSSPTFSTLTMLVGFKNEALTKKLTTLSIPARTGNVCVFCTTSLSVPFSFF